MRCAPAAIALCGALPPVHKEYVFLQAGEEKNAQFPAKAVLVVPCPVPSLLQSPQLPPSLL